jgi:hypothetical protein
MINVYGAVGERTGKGSKSTQNPPTPVPLCPPQIVCDLTSIHGGKPVTKCLSYGTASYYCCLQLSTIRKIFSYTAVGTSMKLVIHIKTIETQYQNLGNIFFY